MSSLTESINFVIIEVIQYLLLQFYIANANTFAGGSWHDVDIFALSHDLFLIYLTLSECTNILLV